MQELSSRNATRYVFLIICLASLIMSTPFIQCLGDDTFIYMRSIKNFLSSGHFEYNVGEACNVVTSTTWFFAWAGAAALLHNINAARYILSFLFHFLAFIMIFLIAKKLIKNRLVMVITLSTIFFDPFYLRWFWAGWEVSVKIAAAALSIFVLLSITMSSSRRMFFLAGLCAGIAALTRPEMFILAILGFIYLTVKYPKKALYTIYYLIGFSLITVPWTIFAYKAFGWIIPHTVFAKTIYETNFLLYLSTHGIKFLKIILIPLIPLFLLLFYFLYKSFKIRTSSMLFAHKSFRNFSLNREAFIDLLFVAIWGCAVFGYVITGSFIASTYTSLFVPFLALVLGSIIDQFIQGRSSKWFNEKTAAAFILLVLILSIGIQLKLFYRYSIFNTRYRLGADIRFIEFALKVKDLTKPTDTIGLWELGVIGYYTDRYIIDFVGLATPTIVKFQMKYEEDYVEKFLEYTGKIPDFIIKDYPKGKDEGMALSKQVFFGYKYEPIYSKKIVRIGGGTPWDHYSLYVLYRRIL